MGRTPARRPNPCPHPSPRPPCLRWLAPRWRKSPPARWCWRWTAAAAAARPPLANALAAQLPGCTLLRTDDFYLPPARRSRTGHTPPAPTWTLPSAGRSPAPGLRGAARGLPGVQLPGGGLSAPGTAAAQPLVILEGSYSHHPLLRPYETLRVFVTCTKAEQTRRLQAREGARYADFAARWAAAGGGLFCAVRHSRNRGFCGGDHPRRDEFRMRTALLCA